MGGPLWSDPLHDVEFVQRAVAAVTPEKFATHKRIVGMLNVVAEVGFCCTHGIHRQELPDVPLYYTLNGLAGVAHCMTPKMVQFRFVACLPF